MNSRERQARNDSPSFEKTLIDWMKDTEQTDDITVMGIRL
jgi:hypothetical protein